MPSMTPRLPSGFTNVGIVMIVGISQFAMGIILSVSLRVLLNKSVIVVAVIKESFF